MLRGSSDVQLSPRTAAQPAYATTGGPCSTCDSVCCDKRNATERPPGRRGGRFQFQFDQLGIDATVQAFCTRLKTHTHTHTHTQTHTHICTYMYIFFSPFTSLSPVLHSPRLFSTFFPLIIYDIHRKPVAIGSNCALRRLNDFLIGRD